MKPLLAVAVALTLTLATARTQTEPSRIYTHPKVPPRDALDKLNLTLAWSARLKTDGARDGLFSVQLLPEDKGNARMIVQLNSGAVIALDAENGDTLWRTQVGTPYLVPRAVGYNSQAIFTIRRDDLFVLDRDNGKQLLYDVQKDSNLPRWGLRLESAPSAGLAADDEMVYVCMGDRVSGYFVPDFRRLTKLRAKEEPESVLGGSKLKPSPQVRREWTQVFAREHFYQPPLVTPSFLGLVAPDGTFVTMNNPDGSEGWRYQVEKDIVGAIAQHRNFAYVGSEDYHLYAFDMYRGKLAWRFQGGAPIVAPIQATDRDVWVAPERVGLYRVDRVTGAERWRNKTAHRFLAMNPRFVYATDRFGNLLVLDYDRGTLLARYDTRDFVVLIPNELTDRLYLAAHDGTIVCLHHRDYPTPLRIKTLRSEPVGKPPPKKKDKMDEKLGVGRLRIEDLGIGIEGRRTEPGELPLRWPLSILHSSFRDPPFSAARRGQLL